jgi:hypothetical protein
MWPGENVIIIEVNGATAPSHQQDETVREAVAERRLRDNVPTNAIPPAAPLRSVTTESLVIDRIIRTPHHESNLTITITDRSWGTGGWVRVKYRCSLHRSLKRTPTNPTDRSPPVWCKPILVPPHTVICTPNDDNQGTRPSTHWGWTPPQDSQYNRRPPEYPRWLRPEYPKLTMN